MLTELEVKSLNTDGRHSVGDSLYLNVSAGNSKCWSWHYRVEGKRREAGLRSYPVVSLKEVRKKKRSLNGRRHEFSYQKPIAYRYPTLKTVATLKLSIKSLSHHWLD